MYRLLPHHALVSHTPGGWQPRGVSGAVQGPAGRGEGNLVSRLASRLLFLSAFVSQPPASVSTGNQRPGKQFSSLSIILFWKEIEMVYVELFET